MKKLTWLLVVPIAAIVWSAWMVYEERESQSAFGLLESAREILENEPENSALAHRMLDRALALHPKPALTEALLTERAELRTNTGALTLALADWNALLLLHPDDEQLKIRIAGLESRAGRKDRALATYLAVLEEKPNNGWVRALAAKERADLVEEQKNELLQSLEGIVSRADIQWIEPRFDRIVRLPMDDPAREGAFAELSATLPEAALERLRPALVTIGSVLTEVRGDQATSLRGSVNRNNLFGLIDALYRAGRLESTVDFGLAALPFEASLEHPGTIQSLAQALRELDRPRAGNAVVNAAVAKRPAWHTNFLPGWCAILFEAENWPQLENAAIQLMRRSGSSAAGRNDRANAAFYSGMAAFHQGRNSAAVGALKQFIASRTQGPVDHAVAKAWLTIAEAHQALGDGPAVYNAYRSAASADPGYSAKAWLFLADAAAKDTRSASSSAAESAHLAQAIAADPARAAEWLPRFREVGAQGLKEQDTEIPILAKQLRAAGRWYPAGRPQPYVLYALADHFLASNQAAGAAIVLERLLRDLPGFVPAYDLLAVSQLVLRRPLLQAETLMTRLELSGPNPSSLESLKGLSAKLEGQVLPAPLLRRWMQLDPEFIGAIELARALQEEDRAGEAFNTLMAVSRDQLSDRDVLLFADILDGLDQHAAVLTATADVDPEGPFAAHATLLRIHAAARLRNFPVLATAIETIEAASPTIEPGSREAELVEANFQTLLQRQLGPALLRFTRHFATSPETHDGRRMNQAALAEALFGDPQQAQLWVDSADALSLDGSALVGQLILAEARQDVARETVVVRDLRAEAPSWLDELDLALIAALEGRTGEARAKLAARLSLTPADSRLWLASAALDAIAPEGTAPTVGIGAADVTPILGAAAREPLERIAGLNAAAGQRLLTILLALDAPVWNEWALARLREPLQVALLGPFGVELSARAAMAANDIESARTQLTEGSSRWKAFLAFWDLNEDLALARLGRPDHPVVVGLRRLRRQVNAPPRGGLTPSPAELALDASFEAASKGDAVEALRLAKQAKDAAPAAAAPRLNLARVARELAPKLSKEAYLDYLLPLDWNLEPAELHALLSELFELPVPVPREELEALAVRYPHAPEPVLRLAQLDQESFGIEAALDRLDAFRTSHAALESLAPGSSRAWFDFIKHFSPTRALAFTDQQLDLDPRRLEPWLERAEALEAVGELEAALELWRTLARMSPDSRVARGRAALVAELGSSHDEVTAALNVARRGADAAEFSALVEFITARSLANIGAKFLDQSIEILDKLLGMDRTPGIERIEIQRRLGTTLLHRARPGDGKRARPHLTAALAGAKDALDRDLLTGLVNLTYHLDKELGESSEEDVASE